MGLWTSKIPVGTLPLAIWTRKIQVGSDFSAWVLTFGALAPTGAQFSRKVALALEREHNFITNRALSGLKALVFKTMLPLERERPFARK